MTKRILVGVIFGLTACGGGSSDTSPTTINTTPKPYDMKVASGLGCYKTDSGSGTTLSYSYENDTLDSGDHYVVCSVAGTTYQVSNSHLYKAGSAGATTGSCHVGYDIDTASTGYWSFLMSGSIATVYYIDPTSTRNNYQYQFNTDCSNL